MWNEVRIWISKTIIVGLFVVASGCKKDDVVSEVPVFRVTITGYTGIVTTPFLTRDGTYLIFSNGDLHYASRITDSEFVYKGEITSVGTTYGGVNTASSETYPSLDNSGNFYFYSDRPGLPYTNTYRGTFSAGVVNNAEQFLGVSEGSIRSKDVDVQSDLTGDYLYYFHFQSGGGSWGKSLRMAKKSGTGYDYYCCPFLQDVAKAHMDVYGVGIEEFEPSISGDGLQIFFVRRTVLVNNGEPSSYNIIWAKRNATDEAFGFPVVIGLRGDAKSPALSADGKILYFIRGQELFFTKL